MKPRRPRAGRRTPWRGCRWRRLRSWPVFRLTYAGAPALDQAHDAARSPEHGRDEHGSHHRGVQFEKAADPIAQAEEDPRADESADDGAGPADDRHERDLDGNLERSCVRIDEAFVVDLVHAREARDGPAADGRRGAMIGGAMQNPGPHAL